MIGKLKNFINYFMLLADIRKKSFKDYQSLIPLFPDAK